MYVEGGPQATGAMPCYGPPVAWCGYCYCIWHTIVDGTVIAIATSMPRGASGDVQDACRSRWHVGCICNSCARTVGTKVACVDFTSTIVDFTSWEKLPVAFCYSVRKHYMPNLHYWLHFCNVGTVSDDVGTSRTR